MYEREVLIILIILLEVDMIRVLNKSNKLSIQVITKKELSTDTISKEIPIFKIVKCLLSALCFSSYLLLKIPLYYSSIDGTTSISMKIFQYKIPNSYTIPQTLHILTHMIYHPHMAFIPYTI